MTIRASKALLLCAFALYYTLVVFNNITDPNSNLAFVRHVLLMDTTFLGNNGMWRAIHSPAVPLLFFGSIILWEIITCLLCWWAGIRLLRNLRADAIAFNSAKRLGVIALTLSLLMWLLAFLTIGSEWFLMWQSKVWNGQEAAARMFNVAGILLLYLVMPDAEGEA